MKTKKFISMMSLTLGLLVSVFAFTACGSLDDSESPMWTLIGWISFIIIMSVCIMSKR